MRLTIEHTTRYRYDVAPRTVIEVLRLTPISTATQTVRKWRLDVSGDAILRRGEDAFGNVTHSFTATEPGDALTIVATGVVETEVTDGIVFGTRERLPVGVFLRPTPLSEPDDAIRDLAFAARKSCDGSPLDLAHKLNLSVHGAVRYEGGATDVATPAAHALAAGAGVCQDLAHVLVAAARAQKVPARYISGYRYDGTRDRDAHDPHAWVELFVDGIGWVTFDPSVGASATNAYVRLAVGLDYLSASPVRGSITGGAGETLSVSVAMDWSGWHQPASEMTQTMATMTQTMGTMTQTLGGGQSMGSPSEPSPAPAKPDPPQ